MGSVVDYLLLGLLSIVYGAAYAVVSKAIVFYDGSVLNGLRMVFAFFASMLYVLLLLLFNKDFKRDVVETIRNGKTPFFSSAFCGILNYGIPHSLISIAQSTIPSTFVVILQPFVSLFQFFFANCCLSDEKFAWTNLGTQILAIFGSVITSVPNVTGMNISDGSSFNLVHYLFLIIALFSFAFGSVYVKKYLKETNSQIMSVYQLLGSSVYSICFACFQTGGIQPFAQSILSAGINNIFYPIILGIGFTCVATFLSVHCIKELGASIAGFANYGQIIVGILVGVIFLNEWSGYTTRDYIYTGVGLFFLIISMVLGSILKITEEQSQNDQDLVHDITPLIIEEEQM